MKPELIGKNIVDMDAGRFPGELPLELIYDMDVASPDLVNTGIEFKLQGKHVRVDRNKRMIVSPGIINIRRDHE